MESETKIKYLTMQISKQLKKGQNKKDIEKFEKQLEDLKFSTDDGEYRVDLSPSSAHFILERIFAASAFCV
jgi:hypothetical protein